MVFVGYCFHQFWSGFFCSLQEYHTEWGSCWTEYSNGSFRTGLCWNSCSFGTSWETSACHWESFLFSKYLLFKMFLSYSLFFDGESVVTFLKNYPSSFFGRHYNATFDIIKSRTWVPSCSTTIHSFSPLLDTVLWTHPGFPESLLRITTISSSYPFPKRSGRKCIERIIEIRQNF